MTSRDNICPKAEKCIIFNTPLGGEIVARAYRNQFCYNGIRGRNNCKRYLASQQISNVPADLLPNSRRPLDEVVKHAQQNDSQ